MLRVALRFNKSKNELLKMKTKDVWWMYGALRYEQERLRENIEDG